VYDGRTLHEDNGKEILYYHWGRMRHRHLESPSPEEAEKGFALDRYGFYDPALGGVRLAARRARGRRRELASGARYRLSKWRAAVRARIRQSPVATG